MSIAYLACSDRSPEDPFDADLGSESGQPDRSEGEPDGATQLGGNGGTGVTNRDADLDVSTPPIPALATSSQIGAGQDYTCAIIVDKSVQCWGKRYKATLPSGRFRQLAVGYRNACGLREDGSIACWHNTADSPYGDLAEKVPMGPFTLVRVGGTRGAEFACALRSSGDVVCWRNNGGPSTDPLLTPPVGIRFRELVLGGAHGCGVTPEGLITCWASYPKSPILEESPGPWTNVCAGDDFVCAVTAPGVPTCWGIQLTWPSRWPRTAVARGLYCGPSSSLACTIVGSGRGYCTDADGDWSGAPAAGSRFRELAVGATHACGVDGAGNVECWAGLADQDRDTLIPPAGLKVGE